ncbi:putative dehydrogenase [Silvibacterium bohemicum]|uniref:Putative dehydrogenase n=1 Tax=Silvibacterium bohemicum TaxID=1577686 RepID=A0A841K226_9BACT|nr:Gfo/Idh/MocA family oxidoreductase [Silvibacterium bohemicum]MBB6145221.1 putative dehydrogenase [Silvibacterium bohemicum]
MQSESIGRRSFLKTMGSVGMLSALPDTAFGFAIGSHIAHTVAAPGYDVKSKPKYSIKFGVIGLDHYHIMGITAAVIRGGGELAAFYCTLPQAIADFQKLYPNAKLARSEDEILDDPSIKLVCGAPIPYLRAPLGIRAMQHGKDFLSDKPAITTLEQLAEARKVSAETGKMFAIMYSERLEVRAAVQAGYLIQAGAIGKVVQTVNIAPHKVNDISRPDWFWDPKKYGGILTDIGSHQADQFVYYTGSTTADVTASQIANAAHPNHPEFQDFGDMMLHGNGGAGYVRVDWFTPNGLPVWGDGRLFILGTEGYIELRKYIDIAGRPKGNHLFIVDQKEIRYIDCNEVELPFGQQFVSDVVNRTHTGQNQEQALLAAELVLKAQKNAKVLTFSA